MNRLPAKLDTERLTLRVPTRADARAINTAVHASFPELSRWMDWSVEPQTLEETELFCEESHEKWRMSREYSVLMVHKDSGAVIGGTGYPNIDWEVPKFEIGYWCHSSHVGNGYVSEATYALARLAFVDFHAARVELRMDERNRRSWRVAERLGFELEAVIHADARDNEGGLRNTRVYALLDRAGLKSPRKAPAA